MGAPADTSSMSRNAPHGVTDRHCHRTGLSSYAFVVVAASMAMSGFGAAAMVATAGTLTAAGAFTLTATTIIRQGRS